MVRARGLINEQRRNKKNKSRQVNYTVEDLLEKAQDALDTLEPELALKFYEKALTLKPNDCEILDASGELLLQLGDLEKSKEIFQRSASVNSEINPSKWMYLGQLSNGKESLECYNKGITLLQNELQQTHDSNSAKELTNQLCSAHCSIAELYLTDLCFEENAEIECQNALNSAINYDNGNPEVFQTLANLRFSQERTTEAVEAMQQVFYRIQNSENLIDFSFRANTAKLLLECSQYQQECVDQALLILSSLMKENDENIEIWYLMGVAFYSQKPPDLNLAEDYLLKANEMFEKLREYHLSNFEEFPYDEYVKLVNDQLKLVYEAKQNQSNEFIDESKDLNDDSENDIDDDDDNNNMIL